MWDGWKVSVRDKVVRGRKGDGAKLREGDRVKLRRGEVVKERVGEWPRYHSTQDIMRALEQGSFPGRAMITFHPQRWHDRAFPWLKELVWQNLKNQVKRFMIR